jgi:hypothetical protein
MILAEVFTMIEIDAPAERVWQILTDFRRYPEWNPFIRRIEGRPAKAAELDVLIQPEGGKPMRFRPLVLTARPPRELRWIGRLLIPGLLDGRHRFVVEQLDEGRSRLIHEERFTGLLVPFLRRNIEGPVKRGFEAMNAALKRIAERKA